jgi:uncharacterized protein (DUF433 family)
MQEPKKRRGRPKFNPTRPMRDTVMTAIAAGLTQPQIADALGYFPQHAHQ